MTSPLRQISYLPDDLSDFFNLLFGAANTMELFQTRLQTAFNVTEIAAEGKKRFEGSRQIRQHIRMCEIYFGRVVFCDIQPLERKKLSNLFLWNFVSLPLYFSYQAGYRILRGRNVKWLQRIA